MNKFEMQNYEPLAGEHEITAYATFNNRFEISEINIRVKRLHSFEEFAEKSPFPLNRSLLSIIYRSGYYSHMLGLEKELKDKDIAHVVETYNGYSYQAIKAKEKNNRLKVVVTVWENIPFRVANRKVLEVRRKADVFLAVTERAKEALMLEGVEERKIHVIPMGVNLERFKPERKDLQPFERLNLNEDDFIVLFVGRLVWEKGIYDLLYSAKMLERDPDLAHRSFKFLIVGSGAEKRKMLQIAGILEISDKILLISDIPYSLIHKIYNISDIFVLPSIPTRQWQEQFGMVLAEAMASGKAVISTLSGSIPEIVQDCGILVQPNDPLSLYNAIKKLAMDGDLRKNMGRRARLWAQARFDCNKVANKISGVYKTLAS